MNELEVGFLYCILYNIMIAETRIFFNFKKFVFPSGRSCTHVEDNMRVCVCMCVCVVVGSGACVCRFPTLREEAHCSGPACAQLAVSFQVASELANDAGSRPYLYLRSPA